MLVVVFQILPEIIHQWYTPMRLGKPPILNSRCTPLWRHCDQVCTFKKEEKYKHTTNSQTNIQKGIHCTSLSQCTYFIFTFEEIWIVFSEPAIGKISTFKYKSKITPFQIILGWVILNRIYKKWKFHKRQYKTYFHNVDTCTK